MRSDSIKEAEIAAEQRHVDRVYARLAELRDETEALLKQSYRLADAGTHGSLVDRDVMVYRTALRAKALESAHEGLVFGRLDLKDDESLYVGRLGVRTGDSDSLVIDWRAPAAEAFYRATPENPMGLIRRRVLHTRREIVHDIEDDLLDPENAPADMAVVGDGAFLAALSRSRTGGMRDIVATIQAEQDEVIRAPVDGTVIVRGGPGTGKTAVALHRVAWLLFRHRRRYGSRGVLIVGPNRRFTAYIDRVLPSLGEEDAALRSLGDLVDGVAAEVYDDPEVTRIKGSERMAAVLRRAVALPPPDAPGELRLVYSGTVLKIGLEDLQRVREDINRRNRKPNAIRREVAQALIAVAWRRLKRLGHDADEDPRHEEFVPRVSEDRAFVEFLVAWWPYRTPRTELGWLSDPVRLARAGRGLLSDREVERMAATFSGPLSVADVALLDELGVLLGEPPRRKITEEDWWGQAGGQDGAGQEGRAGVEDPFVVDGVDIRSGERVWGELGEESMRELTTFAERMSSGRRAGDEPAGNGPADDPEYSHIVVDEAQDISPMQWRMLARRRGGRQTTWTIVEDQAQSAWEDTEAAQAAMDEALGERRRYEYELTTNYRNPAEIARLAAKVLAQAVPSARPAHAVREAGHPPVLHTTEDVGGSVRSAVQDLLGGVDGTIAVITPMARAAEAAEWVADLPAERVMALGTLEAKGLEFDAVVIADPGGIAETANGLRTLYVALTRATSRLVVVAHHSSNPVIMELIRSDRASRTRSD